MKSLYSGSAFLTALLTASVLFHAHPSAAQPFSQQNPVQQQERKELPAAQTAQPDILLAGVNTNAPALESEPVKLVVRAEEPPPMEIVSKAEEVVAAPQAYVATAYNLSGRTASGHPVRQGMIAADPRVLPLGTRVRLDAGPYSGEYMVADTGGSVRGRKIDVWVPSSHEASRFGRRNVKLTVLNYGGKRKAQRKKVN